MNKRLAGRLSRRAILSGSGCCACSMLFGGCDNQKGAVSRGRARVISLGTIDQIPIGRSIFRKERLILFRSGETDIRAMSLVCSHQQCLLEDQGSELLCPCHGSRFSFTGEPLNGPATRQLTQYPVSIGADGEVRVEIISPG